MVAILAMAFIAVRTRLTVEAETVEESVDVNVSHGEV